MQDSGISILFKGVNFQRLIGGLGRGSLRGHGHEPILQRARRRQNHGRNQQQRNSAYKSDRDLFLHYGFLLLSDAILHGGTAGGTFIQEGEAPVHRGPEGFLILHRTSPPVLFSASFSLSLTDN